jgi:hypothetical protein
MDLGGKSELIRRHCFQHSPGTTIFVDFYQMVALAL